MKFETRSGTSPDSFHFCTALSEKMHVFVESSNDLGAKRALLAIAEGRKHKNVAF